MSNNTKIIYAACGALLVGYLAYLGILWATILALIAGFIIYKVKSVLDIPELPVIIENKWWGNGEPRKEDSGSEEFKIHLSDENLNYLKTSLKNSRPLTPPLENAAQEYGMNTNLLREILEFWNTAYDWRERETFLNQFPQYKINIQGLKMHYVHVKPENKNNKKVLPLLLVHGWPGSVREFYEMAPMLTRDDPGRNFVFELVIPSLPGYGFSDGTSKKGLDQVEAAIILKNLMKSVGFNRFYIQGGDWGSVVCTNMATLYPEHVIGIHTNMPVSMTLRATILTAVGMVFPQLVVENKHRHKMYPIKYNYDETAYAHFQQTKPDTIGVALNDSPIGLAAYIIEKFVTWTKLENKKKVDGGLKEKWDYKKLLDNVMIYWINNCITTSMRFYAEFKNSKQQKILNKIPVKVPSGCARFSNEIFYMPDLLLEDKFPNLIHSSELEGGHFAAFEVPDVLAKDIIEFVQKAEKK
ncbi:unnamed protein product [Brassicogethes aeneus]|uniref:Epoxide hydrolase n=1 Tax=Brassicogethes aeneus TaxID=1431903 RepID=A0A9P0BGF2_BRAAE|nr:unnamed protein product [Brassicogethes aeneus]